MLKKSLLIMAIAVFLFMNGCKKSSSEPEEIVVKTAAQYEAEAKEQITEENMEDELKNLEKELELDTTQEE